MTDIIRPEGEPHILPIDDQSRSQADIGATNLALRKRLDHQDGPLAAHLLQGRDREHQHHRHQPLTERDP